MKKNNGFSLVELLVVITIMALLVGMLGVGISVVINKRVSTAASNTKDILQAAQQVAMSKNGSYVEISVNSEGKTIVKAKTDTSTVFESLEIDDSIQVYAIVSNATNPILIDGDNADKLQITWKRESGAFSESTILLNSVETTGFFCDGLKFVKGNKTVTLDFARQTGRVKVK